METNKKKKDSGELVLSVGQIVKVNGIPFELLEPVKARTNTKFPLHK